MTKKTLILTTLIATIIFITGCQQSNVTNLDRQDSQTLPDSTVIESELPPTI